MQSIVAARVGCCTSAENTRFWRIWPASRFVHSRMAHTLQLVCGVPYLKIEVKLLEVRSLSLRYFFSL